MGVDDGRLGTDEKSLLYVVVCCYSVVSVSCSNCIKPTRVQQPKTISRHLSNKSAIE